MITDARVKLWGRNIGAVSWIPDREIGVFQYEPEFVGSGIQVSKLRMPLRQAPYQFAALPKETFKGLPGLLADSLPDKYGNALIDAWLASQGRPAASFNPVERLCYIGTRGMGALEFEPALQNQSTRSKDVEISKLVELANKVLDERNSLQGAFTGEDDQSIIEDILRVGTSAGGARAKAILAWNPKTNEFKSGQVEVGNGFEHWLMKFDGVTNNRDKELADPLGYGKIEYAYYLMAMDAGIDMHPCRLHHEGGRSHFMTKRFDRTSNGGKRHMQSLGALAHFDYNQAQSYSYEQAIEVMIGLDLMRADREQQLLRAMFNVVARNQDDHVKNIAFLMNRKGVWRLSPAFDISYSYDPAGAWTSQHQMSVNNKRGSFVREDFYGLSSLAGIKTIDADELLDRVLHTVERWPEFALQAGVEEPTIERIGSAHRMLR